MLSIEMVCSAALPLQQDSTLLFQSRSNLTSLIGTNLQYGGSASQGWDSCPQDGTGQAHDLAGQLLILGFRFLLSGTISIISSEDINQVRVTAKDGGE